MPLIYRKLQDQLNYRALQNTHPEITKNIYKEILVGKKK